VHNIYSFNIFSLKM